VPAETGDILIFANKTAPIGKTGNFSLMMNVEPDCSKSYLEWNYAANHPLYYTKGSSNFNPIQPEMIEVSRESL